MGASRVQTTVKHLKATHTRALLTWQPIREARSSHFLPAVCVNNYKRGEPFSTHVLAKDHTVILSSAARSRHKDTLACQQERNTCNQQSVLMCGLRFHYFPLVLQSSLLQFAPVSMGELVHVLNSQASHTCQSSCPKAGKYISVCRNLNQMYLSTPACLICGGTHSVCGGRWPGGQGGNPYQKVDFKSSSPVSPIYQGCFFKSFLAGKLLKSKASRCMNCKADFAMSSVQFKLKNVTSLCPEILLR